LSHRLNRPNLRGISTYGCADRYNMANTQGGGW